MRVRKLAGREGGFYIDEDSARGDGLDHGRAPRAQLLSMRHRENEPVEVPERLHP